jgi:ferredoxin-NADP reductase
MPVPTFTVRCTRVLKIARDIYEFALTKPPGFTFKAGQFVLLEIPLVENAEDFQPRALSIASAPSESELLFVVKLLNGGRLSRFVAEVMNPETELTMKGAFGAFVLRPENPKDYLFVGTSTGIAPFRSQIIDAREKGEVRRMDVVFGVRSEEDLFWKEHFEGLAQKHPNVFVHFALSGASAEWKGHRGRVQTLVPLIAKDLSAKSLYICGSPPMTKEMKELALQHWGMGKEDVHGEAYI